MLVDLSGVKTRETMSKVVPEGQYNAFVDSSELKTSKDGTSQYFNVKWKILDESAKNRTVFATYTFQSSKSEKAAQIGTETLKKLYDFNNKTSFQIKSPNDLLGLQALLTVKIKEDLEYGEKNHISSYGRSKVKTTHQGKSSSIPGL